MFFPQQNYTKNNQRHLAPSNEIQRRKEAGIKNNAEKKKKKIQGNRMLSSSASQAPNCVLFFSLILAERRHTSFTFAIV